MKLGQKIAAGVSAFIMLVIVVSALVMWATYNDCIRQEQGIETQYLQNQNNYSQYFNKIKELAQVPAMAEKQLEKLYTTSIQSRYGEGGSKAVMQFIQEQNPTLDASMYKQIMQAIEAGRDSFAADQKTLLDKKNSYLGEVSGITFAHFMGFPKKDLSKYAIVTNDATEAAFATKKAGPITLSE